MAFWGALTEENLKKRREFNYRIALADKRTLPLIFFVTMYATGIV